MGALVVLLLAGGIAARGTAAAFSDTTVVRGGTVGAGTLAPVTGLTCTAGTAGLLEVRFAWTAQTSRSYGVVVTDRATGAALRSETVTTNSYTISGTLAQDGRYTFAVRSIYTPATNWTSVAVTTNFSENTVGLAFTCE